MFLTILLCESLITTMPTPVYNTAHIPHAQPVLERDSQGLIRSVEMIAFRGTKFHCLRKVSPTVFEVSAKEYPSTTPLYLDSRCVTQVDDDYPERIATVPSSSEMVDQLRSAVGTRYFWGGNQRSGIPELLHLYPHDRQGIDQEDALCRGVDCSGLLYEVTQGGTPRNTSGLVNYGEEVPVDLDQIDAVQQVLQPLDLLVWKGHVVMVLSSDELIESTVEKGVHISSFRARYPQILQHVRLHNKELHLRRWYQPPH